MDPDPVHDRILIDIQNRPLPRAVQQDPAPRHRRLLLESGLRVRHRERRVLCHLRGGRSSPDPIIPSVSSRRRGSERRVEGLGGSPRWKP